jgi:hypothetical protein
LADCVGAVVDTDGNQRRYFAGSNQLGERFIGLHEKLVYEAVKAGTVSELPHESQLYAQAIQEHVP